MLNSIHVRDPLLVITMTLANTALLDASDYNEWKNRTLEI